jgi:proline dehydrogenase
MLRSFLIYLSKAGWARQIVTRWKISWLVASRFIAGETINDALRTIRQLNRKGIYATLDHLGESVTDPESSRQATHEIVMALQEIDEAGLKSSVSIKPSQIGLALGADIYEENLRSIMDCARDLNNFVRIDMEDSSYTEITLSLFYKLCNEGYARHMGIVIQAYLYRSAKDVYELMVNGFPVRICKGAYKEPPDLAFPSKKNVDQNFDMLVEMLISGTILNGHRALSNCGRFPPLAAIASHDEKRINHAKNCAKRNKLPKNEIEFQMLFGIRRNLQHLLVAEGYPLRVYVPYGTEWYPYFMRRLAERPANLWFFITNLFRK